MIKAIETIYNGYRFRSRLEARWAIFFDTLGIKWEYEKEGFDLDGTWYLPDFWLSDLECWVEIKGEGNPPSIEVQDKMVKLTLLNNRWLGMIRVGPPDKVQNEGYGYWMGKFIGFQVFVQCMSCGTVGLYTQHPDAETKLLAWRLRCECRNEDGNGSSFTIFNPDETTTPFPNITTDSPLIFAAVDNALQARFEHGETPVVPILKGTPEQMHEAICDADVRYFELNPGKVSYTRPFYVQECSPEMLANFQEKHGKYPHHVRVSKTVTPGILSRGFMVSEEENLLMGMVWDADNAEALQVLRKAEPRLREGFDKLLKKDSHRHRMPRYRAKQARKQSEQARKRNRK